MAMVDPNDLGEGASFKKATPGRKLVHGVGFRRWVSKSGTPMLTIAFVILHDHEKNGDEGCIVFRNFSLSERALFFLGRFAAAVGWNKPFDSDDNDAIERIVSAGPVSTKLEEDTYDGKTKVVPEGFLKFSGQYNPKWNSLIQAGEAEYAEMQRRLAQKYSSGPSGSSASYNGPSSPPVDAYDDIPF